MSLYKKIKPWLMLIAISLPGPSYAKLQTLCDHSLTEKSDSIKVTEHFISYLSKLLEDGILNISHLHKILDHQNPFSGIKISSGQEVHENYFNYYLGHEEIDRQQLNSWIEGYIDKQKVKDAQRQKSELKTSDSAIKINFISVEPGGFRLVNGGRTWDITLTHKIAVMSTAVTERMWQALMGDTPYPIQPEEYSVTNITWWSAAAYANEMSKKHNLPPVYDFSAIKEWTGNPAKGNWMPVHVDEAERLWKITSPIIYEAKGYRLPTVYEQAFLMRKALKKDGVHFDDWKLSTLEERLKYAWLKENSDDQVHPVAERWPLNIDGQQIYDLYGNIYEWSHDPGGTFGGMNVGVNPVGIPPEKDGQQSWTTKRFMHGFYCADQAMFTIPAAFNDRESYDYIEELGFRLVRSLD